MEGEFELEAEIFFDNADVAEELFALFHGDDDEKVVDVATVMLISEVELDETVELVEKDIGEELAGEVADDDAAFFGLVEETFIFREFIPVATVTVNADTFHGFVVDDLVPNVFKEIVEFMLVGGMAADVVLGVGEFAVEELAFESPEDAFVEEIVIQAHEIALDVEFDGKSLAGVVFGDLANVVSEAFLAVKCAFADAAGIGISTKTAIPPFRADIEEEMMNHAVAKGGGDDFADDGVVNDEGDAAAGFVVMTDEAVAEINDVFHGIELELMLVNGRAFALARNIISDPKFTEEKFFKTVIGHSSDLGRCCLLYSRAVMRSMRTRLSRMSQRSR